MEFDLGRFDAATFAGVPDDAVFQYAMPPYGFVRRYVDYMYPCTDAPVIYHMGVALAMLAVLIPRSVNLPDGDELSPNLFVLLVGPSTFSRKTHTVREGRKLLTKVAPHTLMSDDGSGEGFADTILETPGRLIVSEEGGQFLQHTMSGTYASSIRSRLTALADNSPVQRHTSKRGGKGLPGTLEVKREENPRMNMLMASTRTHIEEHTFRLDWEGGFLSRYLTFWAQRSRHLEEAKLDLDGRTRMEQMLSHFAEVKSVGTCAGMTEEARQYFRVWQRKLTAYALSRANSEEGLSVIERAQQHVRKVALILAYDRHVSRTAMDAQQVSHLREEPWAIDLDDVRVGCALGWFHVASALHVRFNVSTNADGQTMRSIRNFIAESKSGFRTFAEIVRKVDRIHKSVSMYLETMIVAEVIARADINGGAAYWLKGSRSAPPSEHEIAAHVATENGITGSTH